jgi:hypothetical protein
MVSGRKENRFFDDGDFTTEHDSINIWVIGNWRTVMSTVAPDYEMTSGKYVAEPVMNGYPPVFPDGIARGRAWWNLDKETRVHTTFTAVIEIKPIIESIGKVLRQLNIYKDRAKAIEFDKVIIILITATTMYDEVLKGQDIRVFHPAPPPEEKKGLEKFSEPET